MISFTMCAGDSPSWQTRTTASVIGTSTPCARARSQHRPAALHALGGLPGALLHLLDASCPGRASRRRSGCGTAASCRWPPGRRARPARRRWSSSAPSATPSRAVSASPRVISEARVLSPKPSPSAMPHGQRDHVLDRAAELAADHVGVGVRPEVGRVAGRLQLPRPGRRRRRRSRSRPAAPRRSRGPGSGPESTATRSGPAPVDLADHLAHPLGGAELDALHQARAGSRPAGSSGVQLARGCPAATATGTASTTIVGAVAAPRPASAVARTADGQPDAGQVVGVLRASRRSPRPARRGGRAASRRSRRRRAPWRTSCPTSRRRAPRRGSRGAPGDVAGQLARRPRVEGRSAAGSLAQLGELVADPGHDQVGGLPQQLGGQRARRRAPAARCADRSTGSPTR